MENEKQHCIDLVNAIKPIQGELLSGLNDWDRGHIETLARRHNITMLNDAQAELFTSVALPAEYLNNAKSFATRSGDTPEDVQVIHIALENYDTDEDGYFCALHEIGHTLLRHKVREDSMERLPKEQIVQSEIEAWEWAITHANRFPSDSTICYILDNLSTYTDNCYIDEKDLMMQYDRLYRAHPEMIPADEKEDYLFYRRGEAILEKIKNHQPLTPEDQSYREEMIKKLREWKGKN